MSDVATDAEPADDSGLMGAAGGEGGRGLAIALAEIEESLERAMCAVTEQADACGLEATDEMAGDEEETEATAAPAAAFADEWDACVQRAPWIVRTLAAGLVARLRCVSEEALERSGDATATRTDAVRESLAAAGTALADAAQGLELLLVRTRRLMEQAGVERIDVMHEPFDAERMRAVDVGADDDVQAGHVAEQYRPGYLLHGAVLRPAEVRVAR